ncbi:MAG: preprotein translocase subunit SecG, partial [Chromatiales bacterium]|nr:preprotein translocase subunit SecG [Chromatiales bacterium]
MLLNTAVLIFHVFLAVGLIVLILIQRGKGAEAGAAFGAGASGTVFGARGSASFLTRATAVLATLFFATSLGLAFLSGQRPEVQSVMESAVA